MPSLHKQLTGNKTADQLFTENWEERGFPGSNNGDGSKTTAPVQKVLKSDSDLAEKYAGITRKEMSKVAKGEMDSKTMDIGEVDSNTPLVFDPEIISILKQNAPLLDVIPQEGQQGFSAVYNIISGRDDPIGFASESDAVDLTDNTPRDVDLQKNEVDMEIYVDKAEISDFTQAAAEHYMNVEDTTLGERVALHAQRKAQQILYGDPSLDTKDGYLGDTNGYDGLASKASDQGNQIDKSGTSSNFIKDIKSEIATLIQDENVIKGNLRVAVSEEFYEVLVNEAYSDVLRTSPGDSNDTINIGVGGLQIKGVPVVPTHNVDEHFASKTVQSTDTGANEIVVEDDYTGVLEADDTFDVVASDGSTTTFTVASVSYSSADDETTITVDSVSSDQTGDTAKISLKGDPGDVFIMSTRAVRFRSLVPFSTVPLAKTGLAEQVALYEFGALIDKSEGNFLRHLQAYAF